MNTLRVLNITFNGVSVFEDAVGFDFYTNDRVVEPEGTNVISSSIYTNNIISLVGLNAVGKTSLLQIIHFILEIIINNKSLNEMRNFLLLSQTNFSYEVTFFYNDAFHKIYSRVLRDLDSDDIKLKFENEFLKSIKKSEITSKVKLRELIELTLNESNSDTVRDHLDSSLKQILKEDDSIVTMVTKNNNSLVRDMIDNVNVNFLNVKKNVPTEVLNLFDENIDYIKRESEDSDSNLMLKFKNSNGVYSTGNMLFWGDIISSGTIKGNSLVDMAVDVLKNGGYLLVDEVENHLNKQLIKVFMDLFKDKEVNRYGATMIFTTHYPELLDFINRSDNIYVLKRNNDRRTCITLLSTLARNDIKKSDVILSNYIKGTAPKYETIQAFKKFIRSEV